MTEAIQTKEIASPYRARFWVMLTAFFAFFVLRNAVGISFPVELYLVIVAVMAFVFNVDETKALVIAFIPFTSAFQLKYALFIVISIMLLKYHSNIKIARFVFPFMLIVAWELLHFAYGNFSVWESIRGFSELLCVAFLPCVSTKKKPDTTQISRVLAISASVAFLILIVQTLKLDNVSFFDLLQSKFRLGASLDTGNNFSLDYNSNVLGFLCCLTISGLLLNINARRAKATDYIALIFMVFVGLLTVSRTFLVCGALVFFLYILLQENRIAKKIQTLSVILVCGVFALVLTYFIFPDIINNYIYRFEVDDISNGRGFLLEFYNNFILQSFSNISFGIGIQDISGKIMEITGEVVTVPHNGYQELVVAWGLPGLVLVVFFVVELLMWAKRKNEGRIELIKYIPLLLLMVNILSGQFITSGPKILSVVFIIEIMASALPSKEKAKQ